MQGALCSSIVHFLIYSLKPLIFLLIHMCIRVALVIVRLLSRHCIRVTQILHSRLGLIPLRIYQQVDYLRLRLEQRKALFWKKEQ